MGNIEQHRGVKGCDTETASQETHQPIADINTTQPHSPAEGSWGLMILPAVAGQIAAAKGLAYVYDSAVGGCKERQRCKERRHNRNQGHPAYTVLLRVPKAWEACQPLLGTQPRSAQERDVRHCLSVAQENVKTYNSPQVMALMLKRETAECAGQRVKL